MVLTRCLHGANNKQCSISQLITSLCWASYVSCQHDNARNLLLCAVLRCCCNWAPGDRHCRLTSPAGTALSSKPATAECGDRTDRQADGQTDARQFHRPCFAYYASSVTKNTNDNFVGKVIITVIVSLHPNRLASRCSSCVVSRYMTMHTKFTNFHIVTFYCRTAVRQIGLLLNEHNYVKCYVVKRWSVSSRIPRWRGRGAINAHVLRRRVSTPISMDWCR